MLIAPLELHQYHILDDPKICCNAQIVIWTPSEQHDLRKWQLEATGCTEVYWALFLKVWLAGWPLPWWAQDQFGIFSTECFEVMCCQTTFEAMYKQHKFAYKWRRAEDTWTFSLTLQPTIGLPPVTYTYRIPRIFTPHRKLQLSCHHNMRTHTRLIMMQRKWSTSLWPHRNTHSDWAKPFRDLPQEFWLVEWENNFLVAKAVRYKT